MNFLLALFASLLAAAGSGGGSSGTTPTGTTTSNGDTGSGANDGDTPSETLAALASPESAFYAEDGTLVLEAESGTASGEWEQRTIDGERVMLWDAESNSYNNAQDDEALSFEFVAEEAGTYFIAIHGGRSARTMDPDDVRSDTGNDSFVKMTNLETGDVILSPTKLFIGLGSADEDLRWGQTFDAHEQKSDAKVVLEKDTAYRLDLIGRSDGHIIDRVTLNKDSFLKDTEVDESAGLLESLTLAALPEDMPYLDPPEEDVVGLF